MRKWEGKSTQAVLIDPMTDALQLSPIKECPVVQIYHTSNRNLSLLGSCVIKERVVGNNKIRIPIHTITPPPRARRLGEPRGEKRWLLVVLFPLLPSEHIVQCTLTILSDRPVGDYMHLSREFLITSIKDIILLVGQKAIILIAALHKRQVLSILKDL